MGLGCVAETGMPPPFLSLCFLSCKLGPQATRTLRLAHLVFSQTADFPGGLSACPGLILSSWSYTAFHSKAPKLYKLSGHPTWTCPDQVGNAGPRLVNAVNNAERGCRRRGGGENPGEGTAGSGEAQQGGVWGSGAQ